MKKMSMMKTTSSIGVRLTSDSSLSSWRLFRMELSLVRDGEVTIGVANCSVVEAMLQDGRLGGDAVRLLHRTPPYADYVWATQRSVSERTRTALRDAFLALDINNTDQRGVLRALGAGGYLPAGRDDFDSVRAAMQAVGLFGETSGG